MHEQGQGKHEQISTGFDFGKNRITKVAGRRWREGTLPALHPLSSEAVSHQPIGTSSTRATQLYYLHRISRD